jgi:GNAT superfamily N-acetyltransferase
VIEYHSDLPDAQFAAADFFEGWPARPDDDRFAAALRGSYAVEVAVDEGRVIGFVNAISDGVATAFIPWLEVRPAYRGQGVGRELMLRMLQRLSHVYSIDLVCDPELVPYYRRLGLAEIAGMGLRSPGNLRS